MHLLLAATISPSAAKAISETNQVYRKRTASGINQQRLS